MSRGRMTGSLAFAEHNGIVFSSGHIGGQVALTGPLSENMITFGIGLDIMPGSRHWLNEVATGDFGVFFPGDEHDALYMPGSLYATATLTAEQLEVEAERRGLLLDVHSVGGTGFHSDRVAANVIAGLKLPFENVHAGRLTALSDVPNLGHRLIDAVLHHFGRLPRRSIGRTNPRGHALVVARARDYIHQNLEQPMRIDEIADAACASRRTVYRAFNDVLGETPQSYVRKSRLHRIRQDLASERERVCTVTLVANRWGVGQLGRLSKWYRELFFEHPSETLAKAAKAPQRKAASRGKLARSE